MLKNWIARLRVSSLYMVLPAMFFAGSRSFAQSIAPRDMDKLRIMEDSMVVTADSMFAAFLPDTRPGYSERFARQLVRTLKIPNSYYYPFDSLSKLINIISPDDNAFRIFNWEITPSEILKRYYGAIQLPSANLKLIGLLDYSEQLGRAAEDSILDNKHWFGAIYYRIITNEVDGRKLYTLFGLNAGSPLSKRKVLDPMTIDEHGVKFGAPIFGVASEANPRMRVNRFILEYKKDVQVGMNWDETKQIIIFDKLVSQINDPHRKYTYVPSGQYDGFRWSNEMWNYLHDLMPVTILKDGEAPSEPTTK